MPIIQQRSRLNKVKVCDIWLLNRYNLKMKSLKTKEPLPLHQVRTNGSFYRVKRIACPIVQAGDLHFKTEAQKPCTLLHKRQCLFNRCLHSGCIFTAGSCIERLTAAAALYFFTGFAHNLGCIQDSFRYQTF